MSEEEKKDEETPETPETPDTPDTPEIPEPESPEVETPAAEEPPAEEPKAEESPAEESPAQPTPEPASTPSAPLPAPTGPNKGVLFAGIGGVALLILLIIICACCLIWNPFSSGGDDAYGKKMGKKLVAAFKAKDADRFKNDLIKREQFVEHFQKVTYDDLTDKDKLELLDEASFSKLHSQIVENIPRMLPTEMRNADGDNKPYDEVMLESFKKQFAEEQDKYLWDKAEIEYIVWDHKTDRGIKGGTVYVRLKIGEKSYVLELYGVSKSEVLGVSGWGRPGSQRYMNMKEVKAIE